MAGAIHDQDLSEFRSNIIGGRVDTLTILIDGTSVEPSNLAPGYAVERTDVGEYTLTVPKAQYHTVVASSTENPEVLVVDVVAEDDKVIISLPADPVGAAAINLLVASGDIA